MRVLYRIFLTFGFDPRVTLNLLRGSGPFLRDLFRLLRQRQDDRSFALRFFPIIGAPASQSGVMSGHYFHQDLLVARRIFQSNPTKHVDVGSRIDGFVAHVAAFREIEVFDLNPPPGQVPNIVCRRFDFMQPAPEDANYCDSISSLHAIEHFGLGRYGDPVDFNGHRRGLENIHFLLKPGGRFYFAVPIGPQRIEFNAHRVFAVGHLLELLEGRFRVDAFHYVDDAGDLNENAGLAPTQVAGNFGCNYGCGIFELTKV